MKRRPVKSTNRLVTKKKRRRAIDPATKQLVLQIISGVVVLGAVVLFLTGVWYGSRVSTLTLRTITVEGGQTISHAQVRTAVVKSLEGSYFGLIPKHFAWTYPEKTVITAVTNINRVKNPIIERVSGTELRVNIDEYLPFALWCVEEDNPQCYFIDKEGIAFANSPDLDGGSMYRFYTLGDEPKIKKVLRDKNTISEVIKMADALESDFNLPVNKIEIDIVDDVFFYIVGGGEIKTSIRQPTSVLLDNLALVLSTDDFKDLDAGTFSYIDLRFGNKVFVNDVLPEIATTSKDFSIDRDISDDVGEDILETVMEEMKQVVNDTEEGNTNAVEITASSSDEVVESQEE